MFNLKIFKKFLSIILLSSIFCGFLGLGVANAEITSTNITYLEGSTGVEITTFNYKSTAGFEYTYIALGRWQRTDTKEVYGNSTVFYDKDNKQPPADIKTEMDKVDAMYNADKATLDSKNYANSNAAKSGVVTPIDTAPSTPSNVVATNTLILDYHPLTATSSLESILGKGQNGNIIQNLPSFLGSIFNFGIAAAVVLTVIMLIWGGIEYMTVESWTGKSDATTRIKNALAGLALALGSYVILYTINPCLVDFLGKKAGGCSYANSLLETPKEAGKAIVTPKNLIVLGQPLCPSPAEEGVICQPCKDKCINAVSDPYNIKCGPSASCWLNEDYAANLKKSLNTSDLYISEGWPARYPHKEGCHTNGTCADIGGLSNTSPEYIIKIYSDFTNAGFNHTIFELPTGYDCGLYETEKIGMPDYIKSGRITGCLINPGASGPHFHVSRFD